MSPISVSLPQTVMSPSPWTSIPFVSYLWPSEHIKWTSLPVRLLIDYHEGRALCSAQLCISGAYNTTWHMLDKQWNLNIQSLQFLSFLLILEAFPWTPGKFPKMELSLASHLPQAQHPKMGLDIVPLATTTCFLITKARFGTSHTCILLARQTGATGILSIALNTLRRHWT